MSGLMTQKMLAWAKTRPSAESKAIERGPTTHHAHQPSFKKSNKSPSSSGHFFSREKSIIRILASRLTWSMLWVDPPLWFLPLGWKSFILKVSFWLKIDFAWRVNDKRGFFQNWWCQTVSQTTAFSDLKKEVRCSARIMRVWILLANMQLRPCFNSCSYPALGQDASIAEDFMCQKLWSFTHPGYPLIGSVPVSCTKCRQPLSSLQNLPGHTCFKIALPRNQSNSSSSFIPYIS